MAVFARDSQNSTFLHHCKVTDSDVRDLSFGSDWVRLGELRLAAAGCGLSCKAYPQTPPKAHPEDLKCRRSYWPPRRAAREKARLPSALHLPPSGPGIMSG